jgi:hypothetical protein
MPTGAFWDTSPSAVCWSIGVFDTSHQAGAIAYRNPVQRHAHPLYTRRPDPAFSQSQVDGPTTGIQTVFFGIEGEKRSRTGGDQFLLGVTVPDRHEQGDDGNGNGAKCYRKIEPMVAGLPRVDMNTIHPSLKRWFRHELPLDR